VQHFAPAEADGAEDFELKSDRARGVLDVDIGEHLVAILGASELLQVLGVACLHQFLDQWIVIGDEIGDEQCAARTQPVVQFREHGVPVRCVSQMMQHLSGEDDIERRSGERRAAHVGLDGLHAVGRGRADALAGAIEHRLAEVDEDAVQRGDAIQHTQREVAGAAAQVEQCAMRRESAGRRPGDDVEDERRIDCGLLSGLEPGEAFDVRVESLADLIDGGFIVQW